jgi:hypothetical protein
MSGLQFLETAGFRKNAVTVIRQFSHSAFTSSRFCSESPAVVFQLFESAEGDAPLEAWREGAVRQPALGATSRSLRILPISMN